MQPQAGDGIRWYGGKLSGADRLSIGCVQGLVLEPFQACDIGKIGHIGGRFEPGDEAGKATTVKHEDRRSWRLLRLKELRHAKKKICTHQPLYHRKPVLQHANDPRADIVAVDTEPTR